ncbi:MAG: CoA pyrophosphatase [Alphaproteobacteria bacterium]|nr:CoA pyrophosphatase [Alphaproteobacteria bacterium]
MREAVRRALAGANGGLRDVAEPHLRAAAVLVPLVDRAEGMTVILTRRSDDLPDHAGQISFPGGRIEPHDADEAAAALRETAEEIGLPPEHVEILGSLAPYRTGTGYHITPVVGLIRPPFTLAPDPAEVAEVFEVPFDFVLDPANHRRDSMVWRGTLHFYDAVPFGDRYIWGATAGMLVRFARLVGQP